MIHVSYWVSHLIDYSQTTRHKLRTSAARCQLFKFDSISALSNSIFDIIGLAWTSQECHQRFLRTDKNPNFCKNFIKNLFNIFKKRIRFFAILSFDTDFSCYSMLVKALFVIGFGLTFDVDLILLKYHAALLKTMICWLRHGIEYLCKDLTIITIIVKSIMVLWVNSPGEIASVMNKWM